MKLIRATRDQMVFRLGKREAGLLLNVLSLYPRVPAAHQPLSKGGKLKDPEGSERLLEEALAEQRAVNKRQLQKLLSDPARLQVTQAALQLLLSPQDLEYVLQILNDIRVGSWVRLGCPEERLSGIKEENAEDLWAMEVSGLFQMQFLEALSAGDA